MIQHLSLIHIFLRINNISKEGYFKQVSFDVKKGEILGLTGLVGAGRTEVCQSIFGIMTPDSGTIELEGKQVSIKNPIDALQLGIGLLPEDRQTQGLINELPIYQNVSSANKMCIRDRCWWHRAVRHGLAAA